jgi:hypothetical protein
MNEEDFDLLRNVGKITFNENATAGIIKHNR